MIKSTEIIYKKNRRGNNIQKIKEITEKSVFGKNKEK